MKNFTIENATAADLSQLFEITKRTISATYKSFLPPAIVEEYITSGASNQEIERNLAHCFTLRNEHRIIGLGICIDNLIHFMLIDEDFQHRGFGKHLLHFLEQHIKANGFSEGQLETYAGNEQALGFYLSQNWELTKKEMDAKLDIERLYFRKKF
ncbi:hypothetical protein PEDI_45190 [Persicobacter diffluens]|uniref:N-acetyltransferase domain-containing protein n=2 Tax=Persicobacter diffluens TaxID=981 RepID=A0AAN4W2L7_9BACT|nr:hypothetical protein PEDI_45190 [Persicobacter diffluens]